MLNKIEELETSNKKLQENTKSDTFDSKETEQEKILMKSFAKDASVKKILQ